MMGLFSKKKEDAPEIPMPPIDSSVQEVAHSLPAAPGDARDSNNQEAIKQAIQDSPEKSEPILTILSPQTNVMQESPSLQSLPTQTVTKPAISLPELPPKKEQLPVLKTETPSYSGLPPLPHEAEKLPTLPGTSSFPELNSFPVQKPEEQVKQEESFRLEELQIVKKDVTETIFVRIDKFNTAKKDVQDINKDLKKIDDVLSKLLEVKQKEDEEIEEINKSIEEIKEKISKVDTEIFNRL